MENKIAKALYRWLIKVYKDRGEPKDGSRSESDRNTNDLTYETGKENGILAEFGIWRNSGNSCLKIKEKSIIG